MRRHLVLLFTVALTLALLISQGVLRLPIAHADTTAQAIPFTQNWTTTSQITANDNWNGVPGIQGFFLRNDSLSTANVDPRTITGDTFGATGTTNVELDVIANQTDTTILNGGIAEFEDNDNNAGTAFNQTVALQGSNTADAPFLLIHLDTTGKSNINVTYNVRDIDGVDNAAQQVNLQYRVGNSGTYTNVTGGYIADATTGGSATQVTPINVILPADANNQPLVQLRIMTTNVTGNDEWVGIDDINITGDGAAGPPQLSVTDVTQNEGNSGTTTFTFNVNLSAPAPVGGVTFNIATQDNTATVSDNDYVPINLTNETIAEGQSSKSYNITVNGDTTPELSETFFLNVTNVTGATLSDGQGVGTISNDDGAFNPPIHTIQGSGLTSPLVGSTVTTSGIVTLKKTNGFFIQEPDASVDSDPNTSEGILVFTSTAPTVNVGDAVTVTGTVQEFFNMTELNVTSGSIAINSSGNTLPSPITLTPAILNPAGSVNQLEKYEGMRLFAASLTTVSPTDSNFEPFAVLTGQPRPLREPGIEISFALPPGSPPNVPRFDENPEKIGLDLDGRLGSTGTALTSNVTTTNVTGALDYTFNEYRLIPEANLTFSANMTAIPVPTPASDEFTVGGFNIENYADTATQRAKAALAIRNVMRSPDIIGHAEIFEQTGLNNLATQINNDSVAAGDPNPMYQGFLIEGNCAAGDADQDVAFLVKTSRVNVTSVTTPDPCGAATYLDPVTNTQLKLNDRPPLVLRATINRPSGGPLPVIVIVNHLRSLIDISQDPGDGPRVRAKRRAQAEYLANYIQSLQIAEPNANIISVGDYNAFQFSDGYVDVIGTILGTPTPADQVVLASGDLVNPDLYDVINDLPRQERYSFVFGGDAQVLDQVIVNNNARRRQTRLVIAHNDADFPVQYSTDATRPERVSDHDMPVTYFTLSDTLRQNARAEFDGDKKTDVSIYRTSDGIWSYFNSTNGALVQHQWGMAGDVLVPGDYDGDRKTEYAVWRASESNWYFINTINDNLTIRNWGGPGDRPVPGDYDGDNKTDVAIWRPAEGNWYIINSSGGAVTLKQWGVSSDIPVPGDYDGDGKTDIAVWRGSEGNWYIIQSSGGGTVVSWGASSLGDKPVPADYDGDGRTDIAVFRPSEGNWYILRSTGGVTLRNWGASTDKVVPGDYDGDGKVDIGVYRPSDANWYIIKSSDGGTLLYHTGGLGDTPIPFAWTPQ